MQLISVVFSLRTLHCNVIPISTHGWFLVDECPDQGTVKELLL